MIHSEALCYMLQRFQILKEYRGVEVGVRHGDNADYLLENIFLDLILVDPYSPYQDVEHTYTQKEQDTIREAMVTRLEKYKGRTTHLRVASTGGALIVKKMGKPIDFVFIDAEHTYQACKEDIEAWYPLVRPGGALMGHDFSMDGVKFAVRDYFQEKCKGYMAWSLPASDVWCMLKPEK